MKKILEDFDEIKGKTISGITTQCDNLVAIHFEDDCSILIKAALCSGEAEIEVVVETQLDACDLEYFGFITASEAQKIKDSHKETERERELQKDLIEYKRLQKKLGIG